MRRNAILASCLFLVAFYLAKGFYFSIYLVITTNHHGEEFALLDDERTTTTIDLSKLDLERHCIFTVHQLWGNSHDDGRRNATIQWFRDATIPSIIRAAKNKNGIAHIGIHLVTRDAYADPSLHNAIGYQQPQQKQQQPRDNNNATINNHHDDVTVTTIVYKNHHNVMKQNIMKHQCGVVSFMQLDADDMLMPKAFQNVHGPWTQHLHSLHKDQHSTVRNHWCRGNPKQHRCPRAMVTGTYRLRTLNLARNSDDDNNDESSSSGPPNCYYDLQPRCSFFAQGLTVTLPVKLWLQHFRANPTTVATFVTHDFVLTELRKKLGRFIKVYENIANQNHAIFLHTPLSSHYQKNRSGAKICDRDYLLDVLGGDMASVDLLWQARQSIPVLTEAQRNQNTFVVDPKDGSAGYNKA